MPAIRFNKNQLETILAKGHCRLSVIPLASPEKKRTRIPSRKTNNKLMPQDILWSAVHEKWGDRAKAEFLAIPGRRYRIDIAFPHERVAVECDGWQYHGRFKDDFKKGLQRQNILTEHGWSFLRFTAGEIHKELNKCIAMIERAIT